MKLIVLYGAPASGKYTIGKLLAEKLDYKFFHNHLTLDLIKPFFTFGTPGFFELSDKIRLDVFEEAAKQNINGMVFTFVYNKLSGDDFIKNIIERVIKYNGEVKFIQIYCDKSELVKRVDAQSRILAEKLTSKDELDKILKEKDLQSSIDSVDSSYIDNTNLSVEETLEKVLKVIS